MTMERDSELASLFRTAEQELSDDAFTGQVMSEMENRRRRTIAGWIVLGLIGATSAWFLVLILQDAILLIEQILPTALVDVENRAIARFLAPVNSVSGLFGLGLLALWVAFRKLFR